MVRQNKFERLFIYAIGFLLIMEWVWPLQVIAEIYNIQVFILFLLLDSILYLLRANRFIRLTILTSYMYVTVQYLYFYETVRTLFGPTNFFNDLIVNLGFLTSGEWSKLTDSFRTLLLFIVLWLFLDLVRYWLFVRQNILFFCLLTVIYLAILDTFFPYQAKIAIIRTFVLGVFTSGFLTMRRIVKKEKTHVPKQVMKRFIFPLLSMTVLCSMIGIAIPKAHPIWPDPVPYLESLASHHDQSRLAGSGERIKKVGYGEDDSNLGGPFIHDDQVVFIIKAEHPQYWRVETKDLYTGKGWETSLANQMISIDQSGNVPIYFVEREFLGERTEAQIQIKNNKNHIVYPYGASAISFTIGFPYLFNETKEKIESKHFVLASQYVVEYQPPTYDVNALQHVTNYSTVEETNPGFIERYTQLPNTLPERVKELATQLTEGKTTVYEQVIAIENYLQGPNFTYRTHDIAVPGRHQDYVDQFLFKTMVGYCDNFSSAMVVLLRSAGIPARWVKGYTSGTEKYQNGERIFEITNNHAHSWVEVYFPGVGWVPFEPTKGYNAPAEFYMSQGQMESNEISPDEPIEDFSEGERLEEERLDEKDQAKDSESLSIIPFWMATKIWWISGFIVILALLIVLYATYRKWSPYWLMFKFRNKQDKEAFAAAYFALLKQLEKRGLKMRNGETLRSFAQMVDKRLKSDEMSKLTRYYEQIIYSDQTGSFNENVAFNEWKTLLVKLTKTNLTR